MKSVNHFNQNRPVHLARRDVYYEKSCLLIRTPPPGQAPHEAVAEVYEEVLFLLRVARQHARFAIRAPVGDSGNEQFCRFIDLLAGNVKAVLSMLNLKAGVERGDSDAFGFLGDNHASVALQAEEYQRRANDIVRSILSTLGMAEEPYTRLLEWNAGEAAAAGETERYNKARRHFARLIEENRHSYKIAPSTRKISMF